MISRSSSTDSRRRPPTSRLVVFGDSLVELPLLVIEAGKLDHPHADEVLIRYRCSFHPPRYDTYTTLTG